MDTPDWHAYRQAQKENEDAAHVRRGPDGHFYPHEKQVMSSNEEEVGGSQPAQQTLHKSQSLAFQPPDQGQTLHKSKSLALQRDQGNGNGHQMGSKPVAATISHLSAAERSQTLRVVRMDPHIQLMVGPLLKYDTVDSQGVWHGAAMIVTADSHSVYDPCPTIKYEWDAESKGVVTPNGQKSTLKDFVLAAHPCDLQNANTLLKTQSENDMNENRARMQSRVAQGKEIWVYESSTGTFTFWRFLINIPLGEREMRINYYVNNGQRLNFVVPGRNQNMRWAAYSCNGFSAGVNPDLFRGPGFQSGYDPVWTDLLMKHQEMPFHVLVGGGDQLYCDGITREPELQEWINHTNPAVKKSYALSDEISFAIDRFYFNHYCRTFRTGAFARATSSIPMLNMCDDHDLIDGFGSYPDDLQRAPIFRQIGSRGYFFFLLFQCFINPNQDGTDDHPGHHFMSSLIVGEEGPYVRSPSHSLLSYLGPRVWMLLLDCRAERSKDQVCSRATYDKVFKRLSALPSGVEHVVVQLGIPIAYPRMGFLEKALESKFNPLVALGRKGSMGLGGVVNEFNADAELLDDLNDHWTARTHKRERNWFIENLQKFAKERNVRITFLSGDVHCAAVGVFKTLAPKNSGIPPPRDHRYMLNVISSAIVNTPPPAAVLKIISQLASKTHKSMHYARTDETMLPLFTTDTDGSSRKKPFLMGRRNWCCVDWQETGDLQFDTRVEKEKGLGETVGYVVLAPPPRWGP